MTVAPAFCHRQTHVHGARALRRVPAGAPVPARMSRRSPCHALCVCHSGLPAVPSSCVCAPRCPPFPQLLMPRAGLLAPCPFRRATHPLGTLPPTDTRHLRNPVAPRRGTGATRTGGRWRRPSQLVPLPHPWRRSRPSIAAAPPVAAPRPSPGCLWAILRPPRAAPHWMVRCGLRIVAWAHVVFPAAGRRAPVVPVPPRVCCRAFPNCALSFVCVCARASPHRRRPRPARAIWQPPSLRIPVAVWRRLSRRRRLLAVLPSHTGLLPHHA